MLLLLGGQWTWSGRAVSFPPPPKIILRPHFKEEKRKALGSGVGWGGVESSSSSSGELEENEVLGPQKGAVAGSSPGLSPWA